jgi:hypothetical protein
MPGLSLTAEQAARLFGLSPVNSELLLNRMVADGLLRLDGRRQFRL